MAFDSFVKNGVRFYRAKRNDASGNPRVICHFFIFLTEEESNRRDLDVLQKYAIAANRAKKLGWRVYRGRDFGGGFVAQGWNSDYLSEEINNAVGKKSEEV